MHRGLETKISVWESLHKQAINSKNGSRVGPKLLFREDDNSQPSEEALHPEK